MSLRFSNHSRYTACLNKLQQMFAGLPQEEAQRWLAALLGHSDWQSLIASGANDAVDEKLSLDQVAERRRFQVATLLTLAEIEESDALAVINALRPSAACAPKTVNEKQEEVEQTQPPLTLGLGESDQPQFEEALNQRIQALFQKNETHH